MPQQQSFVNRYSQVFTPEDRQFVHGALLPFEEFIFKRTVDLNADERKTWLKMGPVARDFSADCLTEALANLHLCPGYLDVDEFKRDLDAMHYLRELKFRLLKIVDVVDDTMMLAGAEAYQAARLFYQALQMAVAANQPGAAAVFERLSVHFARRANKGTPVTSPPPAPGPAPEATDAEAEHPALLQPPAFDE